MLAVWTLFGLVESAKGFTASRLRGTPRSLPAVLVANMPWWLAWAALTPAVVWLASRVRLDGERGRLRALTVHTIASVAFGVGHLVATATLFYHTATLEGYAPVLRRQPLLQDVLRNWFDYYFVLELFTYWGIVGAFYALDFHRRYRDSALLSARLSAQAAQLQLRMAETRMEALRMELNPHFLFNALNAISGLVRKWQNDEAVAMLARLGDLLRTTLGRDVAREMSLGDELDLLGRYLDIERVRFADRLSVEVDVNAEARAGLVPTLILQPLVENAIRHGIARRPGAGLVRIRARRDGEALTIEVRDTGEGLPHDSAGPLREGVGLTNTRARLAQLYGDGAGLRLLNAEGGGARAVLRLPYRVARESEHVSVEA